MMTRMFECGTWPCISILSPSQANRYVKYIFLASFVIYGNLTFGQTIPVSDQLMQDHLRIRQLEGKLDSNISLTVRPVAADLLDVPDSSLAGRYLPKHVGSGAGLFKFALLPITTIQQLNSHHPYGWNDGMMIPAKGYQHLLTGGFFASVGPLSIQVKPEYIHAANPEYLEGNDIVASDRYTTYISGIGYGADLPVYHEKSNFGLFGLGQSSVRINVGPISLGISNENLWWGPGRRNSLLMSNSSRGFNHITLNTTKPVITRIGSFEGQIISAHLDNSNSELNATKNQDWRYLSGMVLNYQPKWVPGLFIGLTRVFQMYHADVKSLSDYFPLFQPFEKKRTNEDAKNRDQLTSFFARFLLREANAEVYAEFSRNDHSFNLRDFIQEPQHSRAYLVGFQKVVPLPTSDHKFLIAAEITQLSQPINRVLRSAGTWYVHNINHGYTNFGEVLGAGSGPGGNLQTFEFSWLNGFKKIGLQIERYEHNRDFYEFILDSGDSYNDQWVDVSAGLLANWNYRSLLVRSEVLGMHSLNYLWQTGRNGLRQKNAFNVHTRIGVSYYFK